MLFLYGRTEDVLLVHFDGEWENRTNAGKRQNKCWANISWCLVNKSLRAARLVVASSTPPAPTQTFPSSLCSSFCQISFLCFFCFCLISLGLWGFARAICVRIEKPFSVIVCRGIHIENEFLHFWSVRESAAVTVANGYALIFFCFLPFSSYCVSYMTGHRCWCCKSQRRINGMPEKHLCRRVTCHRLLCVHVGHIKRRKSKCTFNDLYAINK